MNCSKAPSRYIVATLFLTIAIIASRGEAIGGQLTGRDRGLFDRPKKPMSAQLLSNGPF